MKKHQGRLEVITGSMFSGKSEELIRRIRRTRYAKQKLLVFSPTIDNRYGENGIYSHDKNNFKAYSVKDVNEMNEILDTNPDVEVIGIDEIQFFDPKVVEFCERCVNLGKRVVVAGLDLDYRAIPFKPLPYLMAIADEVNKLSAICTVCGNTAYASQRLINGMPAFDDDPLVVVGSVENYEARCRMHHIVRKRNEKEKNIDIYINIDNDNIDTIMRKQNIFNYFVYHIDVNKKVKDLRIELENYKNMYDMVVVNIINSISTKIEGNYEIIDLISENYKKVNIYALLNQESSTENLITINSLLKMYELNIDEVIVTNNLLDINKIKKVLNLKIKCI